MAAWVFDIAQDAFLKSATSSAWMTGKRLKRGDTKNFEIAIVNDGASYALVDPSEMVFVVKDSLGSDAEAVMLATEWTFESGVWKADLAVNYEAVDAALEGNESVQYWGEFTFTTPLLGTHTSQLLRLPVFQDLWKGTEGTPLELPDPEDWLAARAELLQPGSLAVTETSFESGENFLDSTAYGTVVEDDATVNTIYLPAGAEADIRRSLTIRAATQDITVYNSVGDPVGTVVAGSQQKFRASSWTESESNYLEWEPVGFIAYMVAAAVNAITTITGSKIFSGTSLTAPNQTLSAAGSLVTRELFSGAFIKSRETVREWYPTRMQQITGTGGSITLTGEIGRLLIGGGVTASSKTYLSSVPALDIKSVPYGRADYGILFTGNFQTFGTGTTFRIYHSTQAYNAFSTLGAPGFGLEMQYTGSAIQAKAMAYNAGPISASSWTTIASFGEADDFRIYVVVLTTGTVNVYLSKKASAGAAWGAWALICSTTGAPTSITGTVDYLKIGFENGASPTGAIVFLTDSPFAFEGVSVPA